MRSELEADVTKMMKVPQLKVLYPEDSARNDTNHQKNSSRLGWGLREPTMER